ncbi:hypothetical protein J2N86_12640 [Legionella lytica]|uniref:Uncharacterized protein n=1 Tax=Legionella lytica TaxID=96232 RepID=A0ABY4Y7C5_9GAMM|nr:hypothetical protein [Legionella lytica]USQ13512.1 hypothetical protein J2N86_12640 [Legionella lytica]
MAIFFDDKKNASAAKKLIQHNEHVTRRKRVTHAKTVLQKLKEDIDYRVKKLQGVTTFLSEQHALYKQLSQEYETSPSPDLAQRLEKQKQGISQLEGQLQQHQPEKLIAKLTTKYEKLKRLLERSAE